MRRSTNNLTCAEFQAQLPDLIGYSKSISVVAISAVH